jgi:hypothetical protein
VRSLSVFIATAVLVVTAPVAALGATTSIYDPDGDGAKGPKLDVTAAWMDNRQNYMSLRIDVERVAKGDLIVFLKLRGHKLIRAVSEYRPGQGTLENQLLGGDDPESNSRCPGFVAAWSVSDDTIDLRIPSRCLDGGDYRDAKFKILTEIGPDADLAPADGEDPEAEWTWSTWAERG